MSEASLIKMQHFFEVDNRIKKEMYNSAPPDEKGFLDKESICKYTDNLEDTLIYIFSELKCVALDVFGENSSILKRITEMEKAIKNSFYSCGLDIDRLRKFYKICISNMDSSFIDKVKQNCVGYSVFSFPPINDANSINEILHLIHAFILNNENILCSIPIINKKQNNYKYPITLRGNDTKLFHQLYEQFPVDLDVGWTEMVCVDEKKLLMMVRDRGHALTIEISINNDKARIEYFIPKICNVDMVNALPGINKVNDNSVGATGVVEVDVNNLSSTLFNFISKVPTDSDIIIEGLTR